MKMILLVDLSKLDLANGEPAPVANVCRNLRAGSRTVIHYDAHESDRARSRGESNQSVTASNVINVSAFEWLPVVVIIFVQVHRIVTGPVFHFVLCGVRRAPMNPDGIDGLTPAQVDDHPLRMGIFIFAGEMRIEIGITFPK